MRTAFATSRRRQQGQSFFEYLAVTSFAVVMLTAGFPTSSDPSPLVQLANAIQKYYTDYSFAMSVASIPNCTFTKGGAGITVTVDTCLDMNNPSWPISVLWP